jgi:alpha-galactosidase
VSQQQAELSFDPESGVILSWPDGISLRGGVALVRYRVAQTTHMLRLVEPDDPVSAAGLRAVWRWQPEDGGYRAWVDVDNEGDVPLVLESVDVLTGSTLDRAASTERWSVYQNGWQSWTPAFARHLDRSLYTDPGTAAYRASHQPHWDVESDGVLSSEWVTVIADSGPQTERTKRQSRASSLLVGFVTAADQLADVRVRSDGSGLTARCYLDGALLAPGESVRSEVLLLRAGSDPLTLLETWADGAAQEMAARLPHTPPTGWCTWYYFYGENTAEDVLQDLEAIDRYRLPLDVILLDDGYQTAIGDWLSVDLEKFPQGIAPVADAVRKAGHRLGIWTAPFGATAGSALYAAHPDWFLRDDEGRPVVGWVHWGVECYALDCTHPEVLEWLQETFRRLKSEWRVDFFKIDFLFAAARPGRRHDPSTTRAQALRRGLAAIREAIGDDAFLLGCGAPLGPCVGLVDGMRIGPDVDPNWHPIWRHDLSMPSTENALRNALARAPFHGRLWTNDPDCLLVRQRGADLDLVLNEMRTLVALVALLGGVTISSDCLADIQRGRLKYLRQALPPTGVSARPLDLFENEMPRLLLLDVEREWGRWWVAGVVNWGDRTARTTVRLTELGLPPGQYHVYHYWRRRYLGTTQDTVTIRRHQPHETAVLLLKPVSEQPELLTTTFHVCQAAVEVEDCQLQEGQAGGRAVLSVILAKEGRQFGQVLFAAPKGWKPAEARVDGTRRPLVTVAPYVASLGLTLEGRAEVVVEFEEE